MKIISSLRELEPFGIVLLTGCIGCGCLSHGRCELANPGDRAGPGPRYWLGDKRRPTK